MTGIAVVEMEIYLPKFLDWLNREEKTPFFCHRNGNTVILTIALYQHFKNVTWLWQRSGREPRLALVSDWAWSFLQPKLLKIPLIISAPAGRLTPDLTPQRWTPQFPPFRWVFRRRLEMLCLEFRKPARTCFFILCATDLPTIRLHSASSISGTRFPFLGYNLLDSPGPRTSIEKTTLFNTSDCALDC